MTRRLYRGLVRKCGRQLNDYEDSVMKLTLPGLRVYAANEAYVCGVPRPIFMHISPTCGAHVLG